MSLFIYKVTRQAKLFLFIVLIKTSEYRNFFLLLISGSINRSHHIALQYKSLLERERFTNWLLIQRLTVANKLLNLLPKLRPGAFATRLNVYGFIRGTISVSGVAWIQMYFWNGLHKISVFFISDRFSNSISRQQFNYMLCKSMDWFLYDRDLHHGRVHHINETMLPPPQQSPLRPLTSYSLCLFSKQLLKHFKISRNSKKMYLKWTLKVTPLMKKYLVKYQAPGDLRIE